MREYAQLYLKIVKEIGIAEVYTLGTRLAEISPRGKACGYGTNKEAVKRLEENNVTLMKNEIAPYFTNVLLGVASEKFGMTGYRINSNHGEKPPYEDSVRQILDILEKVSGISYDKTIFDEVIDDWISSMKLINSASNIYRN